MGDAQTNVPLKVEFVLSGIDIPEEFEENNDDLLVRISFNDRNKFYLSPRSPGSSTIDTSAKGIIVDNEGSAISHLVMNDFQRGDVFGQLQGNASMSVQVKAYANEQKTDVLCESDKVAIDVAKHISGAELNNLSPIALEVSHGDNNYTIELIFKKRILNRHNDAQTAAAKIPGYIAVRCGRFIPENVANWDESSRDCVVSIEMDEESRKFTFFNTFQNTESDLIVSSNVSSKFLVEAVPDDITDDDERAAWPRNPIALTYQHCENIASGTTKFNICVFLDNRITAAKDTPDIPEMEPVDGRPDWKLSKTAFVKNGVLTRTVEIGNQVLHEWIKDSTDGVAKPNFVKVEFTVGGFALGYVKVGLRAFVDKKQLHDHLLFELVSVAQVRANYIIDNVLIDDEEHDDEEHDDEEHDTRFGVLRTMLAQWRDCLLNLPDRNSNTETVNDVTENVDKINGVLEFLSLIPMTDLAALADSINSQAERHQTAFSQLQVLAFIAKTVHKKLGLDVTKSCSEDATIFPATWVRAEYTDRSWNAFMISWKDQAVVSAELVFSTCKTIAAVCADIPATEGIISVILGVINMIEKAREVGDVVETLLQKIQTIGDELRAAQKADNGAPPNPFLAKRERVVRKIAADCFKVISAYSTRNRTFGFLTATSVVTSLQALEQKLDAALNHWMNTNIGNQITILNKNIGDQLTALKLQVDALNISRLESPLPLPINPAAAPSQPPSSQESDETKRNKT